MQRLFLALVLGLTACGGGAAATSPPSPTATESANAPPSAAASAETSPPPASATTGGEFQLSHSDTAETARGEHPSAITATPTHAAMRLFVTDPNAGPTPGIVVKLTDPEGQAYFTPPTDAQGYTEVLVPAGRRYELEYLSLGRRATTAQVEVPAGGHQDIRLTLRYRRWRPQPAAATPLVEGPQPSTVDAPAPPEPRGLVLDGILFESGSARIDPESNARLDRIVEYMSHLPGVRLQIAGHTDNVGNPQRNQELSRARAEAVRDYLVAHGIDRSRLEAIGFGDTRPVAPNETEAGRQQNRRIEATEL